MTPADDAARQSAPEPGPKSGEPLPPYLAALTGGSGTLLRVRVIPNAPRSGPDGLRGDRLLLRIKAPPVEGRANEAVIAWAAEAFGLRQAEVEIVRGAHQRDKDLVLAGVTPADAARALAV